MTADMKSIFQIIRILIVFALLVGCSSSPEVEGPGETPAEETVVEYERAVEIEENRTFSSSEAYEVFRSNLSLACEEKISEWLTSDYYKIETPEDFDSLVSCFDIGDTPITGELVQSGQDTAFYFIRIWATSSGHTFSGFSTIVDGKKIQISGSFSYNAEYVYTADMAPYYALVVGSFADQP